MDIVGLDWVKEGFEMVTLKHIIFMQSRSYIIASFVFENWNFRGNREARNRSSFHHSFVC